MKKIFNALVINTAAQITEVAVIKGEKTFYRSVMGKSRTSEALFPLIDEALAEAEISVTDLDYLGCVVGPGSFTGIRIGVSAIRAIGYAYGIKCVPVTYFAVLAYKITESGDYAVITDAGNGVSYLFMDGNASVVTNADATDICRRKGYKIITDKKDIDGAIYSDGDLIKAFYASIDDAKNYDEIVPVYLRKPQAERKAGDL